MELFFVVQDFLDSSGGSAPNIASVALSLLEHSLTFAVGSRVQNENVQTKNVDDLMGEPSFA